MGENLNNIGATVELKTYLDLINMNDNEIKQFLKEVIVDKTALFNWYSLDTACSNYLGRSLFDIIKSTLDEKLGEKGYYYLWVYYEDFFDNGIISFGKSELVSIWTTHNYDFENDENKYILHHLKLNSTENIALVLNKILEIVKIINRENRSKKDFVDNFFAI